MRLRVLSAADLEAALTMPRAIEAMAGAFGEASLGRAVMPPRASLNTPAGVTLVMPALLPALGAMSLKAVSIYPQNPGLGLPTIHGLVLALDPATGQPLAIMDGGRLTAIRTGAASGAATQALALPQARVMAMLGAGGLAWDQVGAMLAVRPVTEVRIFDLVAASAQALARRLRQARPGLTALAVASPGEAVRGAQIISCATTSRDYLFDPADVSPGAHINGVGSFTPQMREVPVGGLPAPRIFVDNIEMAWLEAGELIEARDQGRLDPNSLIELGLVLAGRAPGRTQEGEITFFKSVGIAAQDAAAALAALEGAQALGLGTLLDL